MQHSGAGMGIRDKDLGEHAGKAAPNAGAHAPSTTTGKPRGRCEAAESCHLRQSVGEGTGPVRHQPAPAP